MTEWNPKDPFDLGIWGELGEPCPEASKADSDTEVPFDLLLLKRAKKASRKPSEKSKKEVAGNPQMCKKGKRSVSRAPNRTWSLMNNHFALKI